MAYSNWGARVFKNGVRRTDKEDVGVFDTEESDLDSGLRIFANLLKAQAKYGAMNASWYEHSHHAVLGDGAVRLCGYKCTPELWVTTPSGIERVPLPDLCSRDGEIKDAAYTLYAYKPDAPIDSLEKVAELEPYEGEYVYSVRHYDGNMIELSLIEPDGTKWTAVCGYWYGDDFTES